MRILSALILVLTCINTICVVGLLLERRGASSEFSYSAFHGVDGIEIPIRTNLKTGDSETYWPGKGWVNEKADQMAKDSAKKAIELKTCQIPAKEWVKVTGNAGPDEWDRNVFKGKLYNGTTWKITGIVVRLKCSDSLGTEQWTRDFRVNEDIAPLSTEAFEFKTTGVQRDSKVEWFIFDLFGVP